MGAYQVTASWESPPRDMPTGHSQTFIELTLADGRRVAARGKVDRAIRAGLDPVGKTLQVTPSVRGQKYLDACIF